MAIDRLQKIIARAGVTSRRKAEEYITSGRVTVNGKPVTELGARADTAHDVIEVDGRRIELPDTWTYIILNKPAGIVTTAADEFERDTVLDILGLDVRVYPVGRLDLDAEGLLLLTNDGDLAAALTHPAGEVPKTYRVKVRGRPSEDTLTRLLLGVELDDGPAAATYVQLADTPRRPVRTSNTWIDLTVTEGRNHLVKRLCAAIGHPVVRLRRIQFANLTLHGLRAGQWRPLAADELRHLRTIAEAARKRRRASSPKKSATKG